MTDEQLATLESLGLAAIAELRRLREENARLKRRLEAQIMESTKAQRRVKELEADNAALVAYGKEAKRRLDGEPSPKYVITEA